MARFALKPSAMVPSSITGGLHCVSATSATFRTASPVPLPITGRLHCGDVVNYLGVNDVLQVPLPITGRLHCGMLVHTEAFGWLRMPPPITGGLH